MRRHDDPRARLRLLAAAARLRANITCAIVVVGALDASASKAWLFFEHDQIAARATKELAPEQRAVLQAAWEQGVVVDGARYCKDVSAGVSTATVSDGDHWCVGMSTLSAFAGDHACTVGDVTATVDKAAWAGPLLVYERDLAARMAAPQIRDEERVNEWRAQNLALQEIDEQYVSRAGSNAAHFLRPIEGAVNVDGYVRRSLHAGDGLDATSAYAAAHLRALAAAARASPHCATAESDDSSAPGPWRCSDDAKADLREALVTEAFAEHFLEDTFSAGHIVGSWGDIGQRLGTHDHYSEYGLDVRTWSGERYSAHGDAFLTAEDVQRASAAVAVSLAQLVEALRGDAPFDNAGAFVEVPSVCTTSATVPAGIDRDDRVALIGEVVALEPVPSSRATGVPRFRSEVGPFVGLSADAVGMSVFSANGLALSDARLRLGAGAGFALEGAFSKFMDGEIFVEGMILVSMHEYAVDRRSAGFGVRARMPFWLLPGDLAYVVAPIAAFNPQLAYQLAHSAVAGGIGRVESQVILTRSLSFQLVLGREATGTWLPELGYSLDVPVFQLNGDRLYTGAFATGTVLQLGAAVHRTNDQQVYVGIFVEVAERARRFIPQE